MKGDRNWCRSSSLVDKGIWLFRPLEHTFDDKFGAMDSPQRLGRYRELLRRYRDRYEIEDLAESFDRLEATQMRRERQLAALRRRASQLESDLVEVKAKIDAVKSEIEGTEKAQEVLAAEIVEDARMRFTEAWSPLPILGYRTWVIHENRLRGVKLIWTQPNMAARCLTRVPGEDVPHSERRCGAPACGVYATKSLRPFTGSGYGLAGRELAIGVVAMTGKVIEHDVGYRAGHARAVAAVARMSGRWFSFDSPDSTADLFADPAGIAASSGSAGVTTRAEAEELLSKMKEKIESWT